MAEVLIVYSTTDGHTLKICRRLQQVVEAQDHQVRLVSIDDVEPRDLAGPDKLVVGASIRYGKHNPKVYRFIEDNARVLESKPNAFFSVNVVARKPEKRGPDTNPYVKKFLKQIAWKPGKVAVFAGKIDYPRYSLMDRSIIRLIMWLTKGPTDPSTVIEFTDWEQVDAFGRDISGM
jgi:menaquinone-dependent protoporphyrinogen oxidase